MGLIKLLILSPSYGIESILEQTGGSRMKIAAATASDVHRNHSAFTWTSLILSFSDGL